MTWSVKCCFASVVGLLLNPRTYALKKARRVECACGRSPGEAEEAETSRSLGFGG